MSSPQDKHIPELNILLCYREEFEGQLDYDLGNLMACDPSPQDTKALMENPDAYCLEQATKITQSLVNQLFKLPGKLVGMGRVVELPDPTYRLPRQKPLPTPRPPTRYVNAYIEFHISVGHLSPLQLLCAQLLDYY